MSEIIWTMDSDYCYNCGDYLGDDAGYDLCWFCIEEECAGAEDRWWYEDDE